jgi:hypothetical protein
VLEAPCSIPFSQLPAAHQNVLTGCFESEADIQSKKYRLPITDTQIKMRIVIQYTPVDSIATVSTPHASSQSAKQLRSVVKLENSRTGSSSRSGGAATKWEALPMSMPAALGVDQAQCLSELGRLQTQGFIALRQGFLHHALWNAALDRVRRLAHSLINGISISQPMAC